MNEQRNVNSILPVFEKFLKNHLFALGIWIMDNNTYDVSEIPTVPMK